MPFKSEKQRRFLWLKHPDIAKRWADEYPNQKKLPMYADNADKAGDKEKAAAMNVLKSALVNSLIAPVNIALATTYDKSVKRADSKQEYITVPHSTRPTSAGEEHVTAQPKPDTETEGHIRDDDRPKVNLNPLLQKLAVVLSPKITQALENEKAQIEARQASRMPNNANVKSYPPATPTIPLPMGMTQPAPAAPAQAPAQPAPAQAPPQQAPPVGGGASPNANPINAFGGLSTSGDINGNASLGTANAPGAAKLAANHSYFGKLAGTFAQSARTMSTKNALMAKRTKSAEVYDASQPLNGPKPKVEYMNHKQCSPYEFGARVKEATDAWKYLLPIATGAAGGGAGLYTANRSMSRDMSDPTGNAAWGEYQPMFNNDLLNFNSRFIGPRLRTGAVGGALGGAALGAIPLAMDKLKSMLRGTEPKKEKKEEKEARVKAALSMGAGLGAVPGALAGGLAGAAAGGGLGYAADGGKGGLAGMLLGGGLGAVGGGALGGHVGHSIAHGKKETPSAAGGILEPITSMGYGPEDLESPADKLIFDKIFGEVNGADGKKETPSAEGGMFAPSTPMNYSPELYKMLQQHDAQDSLRIDKRDKALAQRRQAGHDTELWDRGPAEQPLNPQLAAALRTYLQLPETETPDGLDAIEALLEHDDHYEPRHKKGAHTLQYLSRTKTAQLYNFGAKVALDLSQYIPEGTGTGAALGAGLGGLYGAVAPGHTDVYDDEGNVIGKKPRSRLGAAMRGVLGGGLAGAVGGSALGAVKPEAISGVQGWLQHMMGRHQSAPATEPELQLGPAQGPPAK